MTREPAGAAPAEDELRQIQSTLGWQVLHTYRSAVSSSRVLRSVHSVLTWPARRLVRAPAPRDGSDQLTQFHASIGWRVLAGYRRLIRSSGLLSSVHAAAGWPVRKLVARRRRAAAVAAATAADGGRRIMSGAESPWRGRGEGWRRPGAGNPAHRHLRYPLYLPSPALTPFERLVSTLHWSVVKCTVCGGLAPLYIEHENLRETGICARCHARTRHRQLAYVVCHSLSTARGLKLRNLRDVARLESLVVYNTESKGAIHDVLSRRADYLCSEYLDPALASGTVVNGIMHQDLMSLSFPSESIDVVLSSDVFEHVADPYQGHAEVHRVLRPGGRHVFTVPFYQTEFLDEVRATVDAQGNLVHHLEPVYHQDPVRLSEGVLVYTIFSVEMLARLRRIGFRTHVYLLHSYWHGMMGPNGLLFEAIKE